ncbi:hypothetical protein IEQ34_019559 [Dendrobium chrysotoxum]|uniref:Uncharacterized protein n=1 Tax=Dendrobium chrysotoxum TaxID=161865 RepID=A0AAV7G823_DENCH|nr:hypothetical protein IEQ34_019559 [Dendrobium chrysotoxum]
MKFQQHPFAVLLSKGCRLLSRSSSSPDEEVIYFFLVNVKHFILFFYEQYMLGIHCKNFKVVFEINDQALKRGSSDMDAGCAGDARRVRHKSCLKDLNL